VLRSTKSDLSGRYTELSDNADTVLDVTQIARWAGCQGDETTVMPIGGARHDVFLSRPASRERAYAAVDGWLSQHRFAPATAAAAVAPPAAAAAEK
jgi:alpha-beta hydrolase superfamily lysophospholipase